ncbi:hypothetical protein PVAP13_9KG136785 [Panicum virgatum]|uniref:Uncharacterized protein n=1 Tax=Panicum virgatum TaxID=38727 RepID=A0A8T0NH61_PANVG|nr:hypothetical protein PVAP13_9KG136785 [Panicum virgatum]
MCSGFWWSPDLVEMVRAEPLYPSPPNGGNQICSLTSAGSALIDPDSNILLRTWSADSADGLVSGVSS